MRAATLKTPFGFGRRAFRPLIRGSAGIKSSYRLQLKELRIEMLNKTGPLVLIAAIAGISLFGCSQETRNDYHAAGSSVADAAKDTGKAIDADAKDVERSIADAGSSVQRANRETSARVRRAILDAPDIVATDLVVETKERNVTLRGIVETEVQNQSAEHIVRDLLGPAYTVDDQLTIGG